jgi:hypothetical protein
MHFIVSKVARNKWSWALMGDAAMMAAAYDSMDTEREAIADARQLNALLAVPVPIQAPSMAIALSPVELPPSTVGA